MGQNQFAARTLRAVWMSAWMVLACAPFCTAQDALENPAEADLPGLDPAAEDVLDMDLDELAQADVMVPALDEMVTSVSRQESTVGRSAAAVFVVTPEMIRRSGARNIPDLLRMVPGVEVARIDSNKWAISIRGFNSRFANKLLVQIDGRSVYTQAFSGVFWDELEFLPLEDIARIEVIRGPGATVWGANAVNGVINIITKSAADTQGPLVLGGTGTEEQGFSTVRYGDRVGDDLHWRVYGKQFERDGGFFAGPEFDDWRMASAGFRVDWTPTACDSVMLQGNYFGSALGSAANSVSLTSPFPTTEELFNRHTRNQHYIARWTRVLSDDSDWSLQAYYDDVERQDQNILDEQDSFNLDFQYRFPWRQRHQVISGLGYRQIDDHLVFHEETASASRAQRNTNLFSYFVQDEITLEEDRWYLTAGSKFEHNDFSGFEFQPSIRLLHLPSERESMWFSVSRAVRTPSRVEEDVSFLFPVSDPDLGTFVAETVGNPAIEAEDLLAFEWGYRAQPTDEFSWDLAAFYNNYEDLIGTAPNGAPFFDPDIGALVIPTIFANSLSADTYGMELTSTYRASSEWELTGSYSLLYLDVHAEAGGFNVTQRSSAHNRLFLRSSWTPRSDLELDFIGRYVDNLPALNISSYFTMDVRVAWRPAKNLEWALVGRNLLGKRHAEFSDFFSGFASEVEPELFTTLSWTY